MIIDSTILLAGEQSKKTVISTIISHFCELLPNINPQILFDQFWQRELLGSTGIGNGVAIPHIRTEYVDQTHAIFIRLAQPIDFSGIDKQPVDLVMGIMFSKGNQQQNLNELKQVACFFSSSAQRQFIRDAKHTVTIENRLRYLNKKEVYEEVD